jgi:hypothetical protein
MCMKVIGKARAGATDPAALARQWRGGCFTRSRQACRPPPPSAAAADRVASSMRDIISVFSQSMQPASSPIIIQGITLQGRAFRPSDWADRLCGVMAAFGGDQQMRYSPWVRPMLLDGVRCVFVSPELRQAEPRAWRFLQDFARDNELVVLDPSSPPGEDFCPVPGAGTPPAA